MEICLNEVCDKEFLLDCAQTLILLYMVCALLSHGYSITCFMIPQCYLIKLLRIQFYNSKFGPAGPSVITPGHIEKLDNEGRLLEDKYSYYGVTDEERNRMGEMCDPYEGL